MRSSITKEMVRGVLKFVVSLRNGDVTSRRYFNTEKEALAHLRDLSLQKKMDVEGWRLLTKADREELIDVWNLSLSRGINLRAALESYTRGEKVTNHTLGKSFEKFMEEKRALKLADKTITALDSNVGRFVEGRESLFLHQVKRDDVVTWLADYEYRTYNTYLTSIKTFFTWCVNTERMQRSPADKIQKIKAKQMPDIDEPPTILSIDQVKALLVATNATDKGLLPYVCLGLFAGLRPDSEATEVTWDNIKDDQIHVLGIHAKDRQARFVKVEHTLKLWLDLKGDLPPCNLRKRFEAVREAAGLISIDVKTKEVVTKRGKKVQKWAGQKITWTGWDQDVLRHTFASHALPVFGADRTVEMMGHGDYDMLFSHYRALVKKAEAEKYWTLTPAVVMRSTG